MASRGKVGAGRNNPIRQANGVKAKEAKTMKRWIAAGIGLVLVGFLGQKAWAINVTGTIEITVTVQHIGISLDGTPGPTTVTRALGNIVAGAQVVTGSSVTVTNDGNVNETYDLSVVNSDPTGWTPVTDAAPNSATEFRLLALFNDDTAPGTGDFDTIADGLNDALFATDRTSTTDIFAGTENGAAVPANADRGLWFRFDAPTVDPNEGEQTITVTITANAS